MFKPLPFVAVLLTFLLGCSQSPNQSVQRLSDPANPNAMEAPIPQRSTGLAPATADGSSAQNPASSSGPMPGAEMPTDAASMENTARMRQGSSTAPAGGQAALVYTCPMHPQITASAPGKCPICGMKLIQKTK